MGLFSVLVPPPATHGGPVRETLNKTNRAIMRDDTELKLTSAEGSCLTTEIPFPCDKHNRQLKSLS